MNTKHTPGPWMVVRDLRQYTPDNGELDLVGYNIESESGDEVIGCEGIEAWKDNAEANARLIAAAPKLLKALMMAVVQNEHDMVLTGDELRECRAAIRKAIGE